jgi:hypothetical protein
MAKQPFVMELPKSKAKQIDLIRLEDHSPLPNEVIQEMKQVASNVFRGLGKRGHCDN